MRWRLIDRGVVVKTFAVHIAIIGTVIPAIDTVIPARRVNGGELINL
jgi:hypothetical protein